MRNQAFEQSVAALGKNHSTYHRYHCNPFDYSISIHSGLLLSSNYS